MTTRTRPLTMLLFALLVAPLAHAVSAALPVDLRDQFGKTHRLSALFGKRKVVIIAGDQRDTREPMKAWVQAARPALAGKARLIGLAELDSVPFFVPNSSITSKLAKELPKFPVLCDWDNEVYERIGFKDDTLIAVSVYDRKGTLLRSVTGKYTPRKLARVLEVVTAGKGGGG